MLQMVPSISDANVTLIAYLDGVVVSRDKLRYFSMNNPKLWWPRGMESHEISHLYNLTVVLENNGKRLDVYTIPIGIRSVEISKNQLLINNEQFYFTGFGMHEDWDTRGKGFDYTLLTKDFNLLEWTGANSFRTSHYPYAEERMFEADRRGFAVIDELPAVGLQYFTAENLKLHKQMLGELVNRDKNHPSAIMWSLANEPKSAKKESKNYFEQLVDLAHSLSDRPVTIVLSAPSDQDQAAQFLDVICINRYYGWYINRGHTELISRDLEFDLSSWYHRFEKPIILTEYGAEAIPALNMDPPYPFTESYQVLLLQETHKVLDKLGSKFIIGEMVWNFADFMTEPAKDRVAGNHKGIFTRNRQPKMSAYLVKRRYDSLNAVNYTLAPNYSCPTYIMLQP